MSIVQHSRVVHPFCFKGKFCVVVVGIVLLLVGLKSSEISVKTTYSNTEQVKVNNYSQSKVKAHLWRFLRHTLGINRTGTAVVIGMAQATSNLDVKATKNDSAGLLLWQPSQIKHGNFIERIPKDLTLENQLELIKYDFTHQYRNVYRQLKYTTNLKQTAQYFVKHYLGYELTIKQYATIIHVNRQLNHNKLE